MFVVLFYCVEVIIISVKHSCIINMRHAVSQSQALQLGEVSMYKEQLM